MEIIEAKFSHWANYYVGIVVLAALTAGASVALRYFLR
jgi:hypothetical protein